MYFLSYFRLKKEYASALAYGLTENGYKPGDRMFLWLDDLYSPEITISKVFFMIPE